MSLRRLATAGWMSGLVGTAAMTATTALEERLRSNQEIPVDYDATGHVVTAAAAVFGAVTSWQPRTHTQRLALFLLVHWGYGSAVAVGHEALVRHDGDRPRAALAFYAGCQAMAFTLFPLIGDTPPPWRWRGGVLASSLGQHAVYATAVAVTSRELGRRV